MTLYYQKIEKIDDRRKSRKDFHEFLFRGPVGNIDQLIDTWVYRRDPGEKVGARGFWNVNVEQSPLFRKARQEQVNKAALELVGANHFAKTLLWIARRVVLSDEVPRFRRSPQNAEIELGTGNVLEVYSVGETRYSGLLVV